ncbi:hypothetical protein [Sulfoacidibacillus ferrooxidans]|uniref:hypothetical protein n=1 Tax=Sulfoacidibacillus ferrooxidans TaxID=2005001 RepID=UPI001F509ADE|nr:hypothetical protein [Sulfoacidibacillus ferrooxidans]
MEKKQEETEFQVVKPSDELDGIILVKGNVPGVRGRMSDKQTEKVLVLLRQVMSLNLDELQTFHEEYKDYLITLDWTRLGINLNWDDDDDLSATR